MKFIVTVALIIIITNLSFSDEIYLKNGYIYKNVKILDSTKLLVKVKIDQEEACFQTNEIEKIVHSEYNADKSFELFFSNQVKPLNQDEIIYTEIKLLTGETINGRYLSSTDSTVTYQTEKDYITINRSLILSVSKINKNVTNGTTNKFKNKMVIKEYKDLSLLIFTLGGGIGAYALFKKASDCEDAATAFKLLNFTDGANKAFSEAKEYRTWGIIVTGISVISFYFATRPTEIEVSKNFSLIPQGNRITLTYKY
jgi:hypothetical protein